jgi:DNA mismatch endonuclease (patch repair protein)
MSRRTMDIAFGGLRIAVFLDGCFWHGCPEHATSPQANAEWWRAKLDRNAARDRDTTDHLSLMGWTVMRFWEHESADEIAKRIMAEVGMKRVAPKGR